LRYVVSGGAGAPLYPIKHLRATARKVESVYHYVTFDVGRDKGTLVAKRVDGSIIEKVGFTRTSFWDDDLPTAPGVAPPAGSVMPSASLAPEEEKKTSSYEVPYAAAGVVMVGGVWFWITRRKRKKDE
jgi:LPXTG-motif cell wall-anchored protein